MRTGPVYRWINVALFRAKIDTSFLSDLTTDHSLLTLWTPTSAVHNFYIAICVRHNVRDDMK